MTEGPSSTFGDGANKTLAENNPFSIVTQSLAVVANHQSSLEEFGPWGSESGPHIPTSLAVKHVTA
eukprot:5239515-Amphidinium_carterae.1